MRVSVVTPTFGREKYLPGLYRCFDGQTHQDRELLVYDDSPVPSAFFAGLTDPRVTYLHSPARMTIGEKRNRLIEAAGGDVIAFFDDDDHYNSGYLEAMLGRLGDADLVKLTGWFALSVPEDSLFYWDTAVNHPLHLKVGDGPMGFVTSAQFKPDFVAKNVDGYGFSYVFRRSALAVAQFPAKSFGEDLPFVQALRAAGRSVAHVQDADGWVVHILHQRNSSVIFPQYRLPRVLGPRLFPGLAAYLGALQP